jgi:hypothetical protein
MVSATLKAAAAAIGSRSLPGPPLSGRRERAALSARRQGLAAEEETVMNDLKATGWKRDKTAAATVTRSTVLCILAFPTAAAGLLVDLGVIPDRWGAALPWWAAFLLAAAAAEAVLFGQNFRRATAAGGRAVSVARQHPPSVRGRQ